MDLLLAISVGLALAAACGFRVFVPLFAASVAGHTGHLGLASGFEWLGSTGAMVAFGTATVLELAAYYIPWLDHILDAVTSPAAVIAGIIASASVIVDVPPLIKWAVVLIGGGGLAGLTQSATVALRAKYGLFTTGLGNPVVSTIELIGSALTSLLAITLPLLALALVVVMVYLSVRVMRRVFGRRKAGASADS